MRISDWSSDVCSSDLTENVSSAVSVSTMRAAARRAATIFQPDMLPDRSSSSTTSRGRTGRSEERRVGKSVSVRVDLGGGRIIKKQKHKHTMSDTTNTDLQKN